MSVPLGKDCKEGWARPLYAEDQQAEIDVTDTNPDAAVPPHAPNSWEISTGSDGIARARDPYRSGGTDSYLENQG